MWQLLILAAMDTKQRLYVYMRPEGSGATMQTGHYIVSHRTKPWVNTTIAGMTQVSSVDQVGPVCSGDTYTGIRIIIVVIIDREYR